MSLLAYLSGPPKGSLAAVVRGGSSNSALEAKQRVLRLYRSWLREAPLACDKYALDIPVSEVRSKISELFRKNANVTDIKVVDMLVVKGQMELDEVHHFWKQKTHVMRYWKNDPNDPTKMDFLTRFYHGQT